MSTRSSVAACVVTLGAFLSLAAPAFATFTISGTDEHGICAAPCTIEVREIAPEEGRTYSWDFDAGGQGGAFYPDATGVTATWTYQTPEIYVIMESDDGGQSFIGGGNVDVRPPREAIPEDIELVSPPGGSEAEFTTSRRQLYLGGCGGQPCSGSVYRTTGPDAAGLYHHFLRLSAAPAQATLTISAFNDEARYTVRDTFAFAFVEPPPPPFVEGTATWKTHRAGKRCVVEFTQAFTVSSTYQARLRLRAKIGDERVRTRAKKDGEAGANEIVGQLVFRESLATALPATAKATLTVAAGGESYRVKAARILKTGCR